MRIILWYFTGTGNTRYAAEMLCEKLKKSGADVAIERFYKGAPPPDFSVCDVIGLLYPVHAFNAPQPFYKAVKQADTCGKPIFILTTSGEPLFFNDYSFLMLKSALKKKKCAIFAAQNCLMPYNILFRHTDDMVKQMLFALDKVTDNFCAEVISGKRDLPRFSPFGVIISLIFRVEWGGAKILGKHFKTDRACNGCGACAKNCPMKNIKIVGGKPQFGNACALCMNCVLNCKKSAIHIGILESWRVAGAYDFKKILADEKLKGEFITKDTKGVFSVYKKYFQINKHSK